MSEKNDGGLAERGGGGVAQPGGSNTASGGDNRPGRSGDKSGGQSKSSKSAGTSTAVTQKKKSNVVSTYGELLPGVRAPVVPGFQFTNRKNQTLQDIQAQNNLGNQAAMGQNVGTSNGGATGTVNNPLKQPTVYNPITQTYVPVPQPKPPPPNFPATGPIPKPGVLPNPTVPPYLNPPPVPQTPPAPSVYSGYGTWPNVVPEFQGPHPWSTPDQGGAIQESNWPQADPPSHYGGGLRIGDIGAYPGPGHGTARAFGGPVEPGQTYTVGERGPETLQMGQNGGGQVIPHNPMDRLGSMSPQMMQQFYQLMQRMGHQGGQPPQQRPPTQPQTYPPQQMPPQQMPPQQMPQGPRPPAMGQPQMGIAGLSRPAQPNQGFGWGGSGLGQPGIMPQLAGRRMG